MVNYPLFSIGIPVIKADFLAEAIECALEQTYSNTEIIILNNAKHNSVKLQIENIVKAFSSSKILYYTNNEQLPIIENWNKVLSYSNGEYFSLLCDDDKWDKTFLDEIYKLTVKYSNTNVFHSRVAFINESNSITRLSPICNEYEDVLDFVHEKVKYFRAHFLSDFVVKTKALKDINGFIPITSGLGSDDLTWIDLALNDGVAYTSKVLFYYRESTINISNTTGFKLKVKALNEYVETLNVLMKTVSFADENKKTQLNLIIKEIARFKEMHMHMYWRKYFEFRLKNIFIGNLMFKILKKCKMLNGI
jgi:glycosyltransferase involved in cell wall biosynthesis